MNVDVAKKWAEELRSTQCGQTYGVLREAVDDCDHPAYCVMGILCEVYRRENGGEWKRAPGGAIAFEPHGEPGGYAWKSVAPPSVLRWAGIRTESGTLNVYPVLGDEAKDEFPDGVCYAGFTEANDEYGLSFTQFAELIEQQAESL